jgi:hypothetical protein
MRDLVDEKRANTLTNSEIVRLRDETRRLGEENKRLKQNQIPLGFVEKTQETLDE